MDLFYKLDTVLKTLNNIYHSDRTKESVFSIKRITIEWVVEFAKNDYQLELSNIDMELVLEKLIDDGYVKRIQEVNPIQFLYYITYIGSFFAENGGYANDGVEKQNQIRYEKAKDFFLIVGSWLAGIGTVLLFCVEIWKVLHPTPCH